jgi:dihydroflavonol-4-reductase
VGSRVLVTGASGLVGANLVRSLLTQGRDVRAVVHEDRRALEDLDVEPVKADVRDTDALDRALSGVEVVYHLAGSISLEMDSSQEMMSINATGTRNLVRACLKSGVQRLIHFSSVDALRKETHGYPVDENQPLIDSGVPPNKLLQIPPYDLSKAQAEREVLAGTTQGLNAVIIRPTAILGPYDFKPSFIGQALIQLAKGRIPALVKAGFDWVDVRDVVTGAMNAELKASPGSVYMLSGNWHTVREVAEMVSAYTNRPAPWVAVPMWLAYAFAPLMHKLARFNGKHPIYTRVTLAALQSNRRVTSAKAQHELEYTARPSSESVRDALKWFKENGFL